MTSTILPRATPGANAASDSPGGTNGDKLEEDDEEQAAVADACRRLADVHGDHTGQVPLGYVADCFLFRKAVGS